VASPAIYGAGALTNNVSIEDCKRYEFICALVLGTSIYYHKNVCALCSLSPDLFLVTPLVICIPTTGQSHCIIQAPLQHSRFTERDKIYCNHYETEFTSDTVKPRRQNWRANTRVFVGRTSDMSVQGRAQPWRSNAIM